MPYLFRTPVLIARKEPFVDWANNLKDGGLDFPPEPALRRDVYLGPSTFEQPTLEQALDPIWESIFEEELFGWSTDRTTWPSPRTRQMFTEWFSAELADAIIDLVPEDPLTQDDMDVAELDEVLTTCGWCGSELPAPAGRMVTFKLPRREFFAHRQGRTIDLIVDSTRIVRGIVTEPGSTPAREGADLIFRACNRVCEKQIQRKIPRALAALEDMAAKRASE